MASVNKVILIGNLGKDPELIHTPSGKSVCKAVLATNEKYGGEEKVEWHNLVIWGQPGEFVEQYCQKGSQIYVEGSIRTESWEDKEGKKQYATKIYVHIVRLLGGGGKRGESAGSESLF